MEEQSNSSSPSKLNEDENAHANLYKYNGIITNQPYRRRVLLDEIKRRRNHMVDEKRNLDEVLHDDENVSEEPIEPMEVEKSTAKKKKFIRLMLSEWLCDVPEDLECNWLVKLSPEGQRRLVIACKNNTTAYNKYGTSKSKFQSSLPGGHRESNHKTFTILDCIYNYDRKTYFVLDILVWNACSLLKCSTEFRFFFLRSKLEETPELSAISMFNAYKFAEIKFFPSELSLIEDALSKPYVIDDAETKLDGVLFYYKEMFYRKGITPLVGWLKPYMIPEVLSVPVAEIYARNKPDTYVSFKDYIQRLERYAIAKESTHSNETYGMDF